MKFLSTPTCKRSRYFQTRHLFSMRTTTALAGTAARWHRSNSSKPASVPSGHSSFRSSSSRSRAQDSWFLPGQESGEGVPDFNSGPFRSPTQRSSITARYKPRPRLATVRAGKTKSTRTKNKERITQRVHSL